MTCGSTSMIQYAEGMVINVIQKKMQVTEEIPEPGERLLGDGLEGVIWFGRAEFKGRIHVGWIARCQPCGCLWPVRSRPKGTIPIMPKRCPKCWSRQWFKGGNQEKNGSGPSSIARGGEPGPVSREPIASFPGQCPRCSHELINPLHCSYCGQWVGPPVSSTPEVSE